MVLERRRAFALITLAALVALWLTGFSAPAATVANDPLFPAQWALTQIGAPQAWSVSTGAGVTIGVIDTGIDLNHEEWAGTGKIVASTNCIGGTCQGTGQDDHGHGTHVSGIAAAPKNNGKGIAGVAPDANLVVAKALDSSGGGTTSDIAAAMTWVVSHGAKVVNLSFGPDAFKKIVNGSGSLPDSINQAWALGAIPVLASGNQNVLGFGSQNYGDLNALVVGATDRSGQVAPYSSPLGNAKWGLVAPGGGDVGGSAPQDHWVVSTWLRSAGGYAAGEGTSMAAPHVAGALALLLAKGVPREVAIQKILDNADKSIPCGTGCHGRLDIARAIGAPDAPPVTTSTLTPTTRAPRLRVTRPASSTTARVASNPTTTSTEAPTTTTLPPVTEPTTTTTETTEPPRQRALGPPKGGSSGPNRAPLVAAASVMLGVAVTGAGLARRAGML